MKTMTPMREPILARDDERPRLDQLEQFYDGQPSEASAKVVGAAGEEIELPESLQEMLRQAVRVLARGDAVSLVTVHKELTTQQAADLLNISRQYLVRVLDRGEIPFHKVGTHRRLTFGDVMEYKRRRDMERLHGIDSLTQLSQELGLYDAKESPTA